MCMTVIGLVRSDRAFLAISVSPLILRGLTSTLTRMLLSHYPKRTQCCRSIERRHQ
jgi:hypothetical protein